MLRLRHASMLLGAVATLPAEPEEVWRVLHHWKSAVTGLHDVPDGAGQPGGGAGPAWLLPECINQPCCTGKGGWVALLGLPDAEVPATDQEHVPQGAMGGHSDVPRGTGRHVGVCHLCGCTIATAYHPLRCHVSNHPRWGHPETALGTELTAICHAACGSQFQSSLLTLIFISVQFCAMIW